MTRIRHACTLVLALLLLGSTPFAFAGGNHGTWKAISDVGVASLFILSLAVPASRRDWQGFREAVYSDALGEGVSLLGKSLIHEERPNHENDKSFPSGHTTLAFAAATTMYRRYGWKIGIPAYAVASLTGYARVAAREHHWWDVVAGAAFGFGSGWLVTHPFSKNVEMVPWATDRGGGVTVAMTW